MTVNEQGQEGILVPHGYPLDGAMLNNLRISATEVLTQVGEPPSTLALRTAHALLAQYPTVPLELIHWVAKWRLLAGQTEALRKDAMPLVSYYVPMDFGIYLSRRPEYRACNRDGRTPPENAVPPRSRTTKRKGAAAAAPRKATNPAARGRRRKARSPREVPVTPTCPTYNSTDGLELHQFLGLLERSLEEKGVPTEIWIPHVAQCLRGAALAWYQALPWIGLTYAMFRGQMIEEFAARVEPYAATEVLRQLEKTPGETVTHLSSRIQALASVAFPHEPPTARLEYVKRRLLAALRISPGELSALGGAICAPLNLVDRLAAEIIVRREVQTALRATHLDPQASTSDPPTKDADSGRETPAYTLASYRPCEEPPRASHDTAHLIDRSASRVSPDADPPKGDDSEEETEHLVVCDDVTP